METLPVTLIVKAPNQQIEDQRIKCELSWTIQKLKQHLSEVYPSKPPKHEQKLIYSGQLLSDTLILKDVLRQYEGQEAHTLHLVCSTKYSKPPTPPATSTIPSPTTTSGSSTNTANSSSTQSQTTPQNTQNEQQSIPNINPLPNMPWLNGAAPPVTTMDANQYAMQLAWMQQAYYQYMTQYMQLAASSHGANALPTTQPNVGDAAVQPQPNPVQEQPAAPQAPEVVAAAAAGNGIRDPDNPERDWLDIFYLLSRVLVLFSVVYFYSSPIRFTFVLFFAIGLYLYQIGFFRNMNHINNNNNTTREPGEVEEEQAPSRLMIVWTFFATFFASLIPEIPNAV